MHLTPEGQQKQKVHYVACKPRAIFRIAEGAEAEDMTTLELIFQMKDQGWQVCVLVRAGSKDASGTTFPQPVDYDYTKSDRKHAKRWWVRSCTASICREYLQCLLTADTLKESPVKHKQATAYYKALLQGMPYVPKAPKNTFAFVVDDGVGPVEPPKKKKRSSARPRKQMLQYELSASSDEGSSVESHEFGGEVSSDSSCGKKSSSSSSSNKSSSSS